MTNRLETTILVYGQPKGVSKLRTIVESAAGMDQVKKRSAANITTVKIAIPQQQVPNR
jgi:hypothetical protein